MRAARRPPRPPPVAPRPVVGLRGDAHLDALDAAGEERDRRRGPSSSSSSMRSARRSARPDSLSPQVRSVRRNDRDRAHPAVRAGRAAPPARASRPSRGARPGTRVDHLLDGLAVGALTATGQIRPGAVPLVWPIDRRPRRARRPGRGCCRASSRSAWRTSPGSRSTRSGSRTSSTPITSASTVTGDVVVGRAQPAAHDHRVAAAPSGGRSAATHAVAVVADLGLEERVDAGAARAARRSTTSWCRRSARAAARCRPRRLRNAWGEHRRQPGGGPTGADDPIASAPMELRIFTEPQQGRHLRRPARGRPGRRGARVRGVLPFRPLPEDG